MTSEERRSRSPRIEEISWGELRVEGRDAPYKDAKLWPGGSREWDWNETGTGHVPGVQPADVEELLEHGAETVVLGRGMMGALQVKEETLEMLEDRGVDVHVERTKEAVRRYNELAAAEPVGALIHSTC
ncbi:MAG: Mth938-like domain-containing protein [Gemmatimonadota bacterium]|nr:Mth938-like domain-containing protein [Gemmatimonadota bacterium]